MELALFIVLSLLASAFFSGMEMAYVSANKFHIELENKKGQIASRIISFLVRNPSRFIAAMLVGNNIALVTYGIFMDQWLDGLLPLDNPYLLLLGQTIISTLLILVVAEFLPKAIFNTHSNSLLKAFAFPGSLFYFLFFPVVRVMMGISNFVMRYILGSKADNLPRAFDRVDLDNYIRERSETNTRAEQVDHEIQIFRNALAFNEQKARDFMVPRTELVAVDSSISLRELRQQFIDSHLSKILVYKGSVDNIIGYVHGFELFKKPENLRAILRPVSFIPESMTANEILNLLIRETRSLAVVLDEFGGTSGLVTLEDVVEELFGEIDDEHDTEELLEQELGPGNFLFSARQEIDYLNEKYQLELPEHDNYSTLGGLIIQELESIPQSGEELWVGPYLMKVKAVGSTKIETIELRVMESS